MVKAGKWFRGLLGLGKSDRPASPNSKPPTKRRWSFAKSKQDASLRKPQEHPLGAVVEVGGGKGDGCVDPTKHAVAVAAATARVAEAAIAAAQAAAAVVQLTSSGRSPCSTDAGARSGGAVDPTARVNFDGAFYGVREVLAAVKIQSHFRAYLSRRALRALKALVRLQALVKGYLVRKHTAEYLRGLQAIVQAQSRARARLLKVSESPQSSTKSVQFHQPGPPTPEKFEQAYRTRSIHNDDPSILKRSHSRRRTMGEHDRVRSSRMDYRMDPWASDQQGSTRSGPIDDWKTDKILEIDIAAAGGNPRQRNLFHSSHLSLVSDQYSLYSLTTSKDSTAHQIVHSPSYCEAQSVSPQKYDESSFCTADNSPQYFSASSKGGAGGGGKGSRVGPFTPTKSDSSRSVLSGYSDHPNYMSYTKSAKAKMRSFSAPRQRPHYEKLCSTKRYSIHGYGELGTNPQRAPALQQAYPGSGRLDNLGMPVRDRAGFNSGGLWHRY
ncbi:unnamed protein product [Cuscuta campestris]|uniref:DUF4005 domain-containing protein n=1 Tax=Cuscuta campestris TaxID=132261 RepID=A0A484NLN1_9ASTE|nr:unnamed protein product [Cuscuta campestris]